MSKDTASSAHDEDFLDPQPPVTDAEAGPTHSAEHGAAGQSQSASPTAESLATFESAALTKRQQRKLDRQSKNGFVQWLKELPVLLAVAFILALLIKTFLVQAFFIPSGSMEQTLHGCPGCAGDRILVNKMSYTFSDPDPGDIVVFKGEDDWDAEFSYDEPTNVFAKGWLWLQRAVGAAPPDEKDFVKRVIATQGQTVEGTATGEVLVNGKPLSEPYIYNSSDFGPNAAFGPITVPKDRVFVMGDHRNGSADSRAHINNEYLGTIAVDSIIGRAFVIVWPFARFDWLGHENIQNVSSGPVGLVASPPVLAAVIVFPIAGIARRRRRRRHHRRTGQADPLSPDLRDRAA